jgi:formate/nitrite transporter FocA (FNT family)
MKFLNLHLHFRAHRLRKSLMIITGLLTSVVKFSLDLALLLLMGGSLFSKSLLAVVVACPQETYILIEAIDSVSEGVTLALLMISMATDFMPNIVADERATLHHLVETSLHFLCLGSYYSG